ncbi:hypothetical protein Tco_0955628 [Tanacetum coccineum]|uniref:Uncharacterized protein n=1 Tax=Tanacetum coccineum TaxID=301880 RepID=A0ABQ5E7W7_9ASTR
MYLVSAVRIQVVAYLGRLVRIDLGRHSKSRSFDFWVWNWNKFGSWLTLKKSDNTQGDDYISTSGEAMLLWMKVCTRLELYLVHHQIGKRAYERISDKKEFYDEDSSDLEEYLGMFDETDQEEYLGEDDTDQDDSDDGWV